MVGGDQSVADLWAEFKRARSAKARIRARNRLVEQHLGLAAEAARQIAAKLSRHAAHTDLESLAQAARIGLICAVERFDPSYSNSKRFPAYAWQRIRGAVIDELREQQRFSRGEYDAYLARERAEADLGNIFGRRPSVEETATVLGEHAMKRAQQVSADQQIGPEHEGQMQPTRAPSCGVGDLDTFLAVVEGVEPRGKIILLLTYYMKLKTRTIANLLDVSDSRVGQLHAAALAHIRQHKDRRKLLRLVIDEAYCERRQLAAEKQREREGGRRR